METLQTTVAAIPDVLTWSVLVYTLGGLTLGIIWGAMPALSTTMAMALLVGFSAGLTLNDAIAFLLAVYVGSVYGGSISAICINIPGTPPPLAPPWKAILCSGAAKAGGRSERRSWHLRWATSSGRSC